MFRPLRDRIDDSVQALAEIGAALESDQSGIPPNQRASALAAVAVIARFLECLSDGLGSVDG